MVKFASTKTPFSRCFAGFALFMVCALRLHADAPATGTIDLRQPPNLKMLFDGGLRPFRLQGLETSDCDIERTDLTIILPNSSPFFFPADRGNFSLLAGNDIYGMDLYGIYTTVPDAVNLTKTICQALNLSSDGLDQAVADLGTMPDPHKGWGKRLLRPGIDFQVTFVPMYYIDHVGAHVCLFIHCGNYPNGMKFLTKPIQPPPGYENVSMAPPPFKPSGPPVPAISFEEARAKVQAKLAEETNQPPPPPQPPPQPAPAPAVVPTEKKETSPWPVVLLVLAAVASLLVWIRYHRK